MSDAPVQVVKQTKCAKVFRVRGKFVNIGQQKRYWSAFKSDKKCKTDEEVAKLLISSFYKSISNRFHVRFEGKKRRDVFTQGNNRILILQNDVWTKWKNLKSSLGILNNSELATMLMNTWYERADSEKRLHDGDPCEDNTGTDHYWRSGSLGRMEVLGDGPIKVERPDSCWSDDESTVDLNHDIGGNDYNDLTVEDTERTERLWEKPGGQLKEFTDNDSLERTSASKNNSGFTTFGTLNKECSDPADMNDILSVEDIKVEMMDSEISAQNEMLRKEYKRKKKKGETKLTIIKKKGRPRKTSSSLDVKDCKKKVKNIKNKPKVAVKKSKTETKKVKDSNESNNVKKLWIHIKLEDHADKYTVEQIGSFERKNRLNQSVEAFYACLVCGRFKSTNRDTFEQHIEQHLNKVLECSECDYVGCSEVELLKHKMSSDHMRERKKHVCYICGVVLYTIESRQTHMGKVHNDPQFKCRFCGEKFVTKVKRVQHIKAFHKGRICNGCKQDCHAMSSEEYKEHLKVCKPKHQCQLCGAVLASKPVLNRHISFTHMGVRMFQCPHCPYAAQRAMRLRDHMMTHSNVHPFSCDQCTFTCVQSSQLKSHMRTHSGEKPFKCTKCKFAAAWNVQLKQHLPIHDLEGTILCEKCDILFKNEKSLRIHERKEH